MHEQDDQIHLVVPAWLKRQLYIIATAEGKSVAALVREALEDALTPERWGATLEKLGKAREEHVPRKERVE